MASNLRRGIALPEAESAARQQFGDVAGVKTAMREVHMMNRKVVGAFALGVTLGVVCGVLSADRLSHAGPFSSQYKFYRVGQEGISSPAVLHEVKPKYTTEAMHAKITGTVIMECIVQPNGKCEGVHVTKPLDPGLDREAMNSLQEWLFQPGQHLGQAVPVLVTVDMSFTLR